VESRCCTTHDRRRRGCDGSFSRQAKHRPQNSANAKGSDLGSCQVRYRETQPPSDAVLPVLSSAVEVAVDCRLRYLYGTCTVARNVFIVFFPFYSCRGRDMRQISTVYNTLEKKKYPRLDFSGFRACHEAATRFTM
jgi:hypothetical protein